MNSKELDILFNYLRSILFEHSTVDLIPESFPEQYQSLVKGLILLNTWTKEYMEFANQVASGDLSSPPPSRENPYTGPVKAIRSHLHHLTWQTQRVAEGDYGQRVDFLGEFSLAFNQMISQLEQREEALKNETKKANDWAHALQQSNDLLLHIIEHLPEWIIVLDLESRTIVLKNSATSIFFESAPNTANHIIDKLYSFAIQKGNLEIITECLDESLLQTHPQHMVLSISVFPINWMDRNSIAYIIDDITANRKHEEHMLFLAYNDTLTGLHNRRYCMQTLDHLLSEQIPFVICFLDLDGLKKVNDQYGHKEGDHYLIELAKHMKQTFRKDDTLCRLGGDEFIILLQNISEEQAKYKMQQLRQDFHNSSKQYEYSISYGVLAVKNHVLSLTSELLLQQVDKKMYQNKRERKAQRKD